MSSEYSTVHRVSTRLALPSSIPGARGGQRPCPPGRQTPASLVTHRHRLSGSNVHALNLRAELLVHYILLELERARQLAAGHREVAVKQHELLDVLRARGRLCLIVLVDARLDRRHHLRVGLGLLDVLCLRTD